MENYRINIACGQADNPALEVRNGDTVTFCSADILKYKVTGLGGMFEGVDGAIHVPAGDCTGEYRVKDRVKGPHQYQIQIERDKDLGTPEIIIVG